MKILINHIGYEIDGPKKAVVQTSQKVVIERFSLVDNVSHEVVFEGHLTYNGGVDKWKDWHFHTIDFSAFSKEGIYYLTVPYENSVVHSFPFRIEEDLISYATISDVIHYFKTQRCTGKFNRADKTVPFVGGTRSGTVDVTGGWYDASGDVSKYLSHLSYANFMNPQQTPMVVWNMLKTVDLFKHKTDIHHIKLIERLLDEALYGADFLVRMQDPAGYFYMTVFDKWSKKLDAREICAYKTQGGIKTEEWQAGFRQGGGVTIAALAAAYRADEVGDYSKEKYLECAETGFAHLAEHNLEYLDNGEENIIDDYCALLAAIELYKSTKKDSYKEYARKRKDSIVARQRDDENFKNWWRADNDERPYFHAAEAGMPIISLVEYLSICDDGAEESAVKECIQKSIEFELAITGEVTNPFGYGRQYIKGVDEPKRSSFFVPHNNETGYWWQGENARLGSLAAAARFAVQALGRDNDFAKKVLAYAQDQLNWILGLNPYDMCMLHRHGRNNPEYQEGYPSAQGGVCNGITGGFLDERDIDFQPPGEDAGSDFHTWRWGEQWIPHGAWFLLAAASLTGRIS